MKYNIQKSKKRFKRILRILILLTFVIATITIWIHEPHSPNLFSHIKANYSQSTLAPNDNKITQEVFKLRADSVFNNAIALEDFIGASVGIYGQETGSWTSSGGYMHKGSILVPDQETKFRLASISKPITALLVLKLVENDLLALDGTVSDYLPEFEDHQYSEITLKHLLSHQSGVRHYKSTIGAISFKHYQSCTEALAKFKNDPLEFDPGQGYLYTTYGYTILGAIIERVVGKSFMNVMEEEIFAPLGMTHTSIEEGRVNYENKASLYLKYENKFLKAPKTNLSVKYPGGGIQSTAEDMLKFGQAILNQAFIDSTLFKLMISPARSPISGHMSYGLGWQIYDDEVHGRVIQHGGSQSGASTFLRVFIDQKIVVVCLANNFNSDDEVYFLNQELSSLALNPKSSEKVNYFTALKKEELKKLTGTYIDKEKNKELEITLKGKQLIGELKPYPPLPIYPSSKDQLFYRHFDGEIKFGSLDKGPLVLFYRYKNEVTKFERKE